MFFLSQFLPLLKKIAPQKCFPLFSICSNQIRKPQGQEPLGPQAGAAPGRCRPEAVSRSGLFPAGLERNFPGSPGYKIPAVAAWPGWGRSVLTQTPLFMFCVSHQLFLGCLLRFADMCWSLGLRQSLLTVDNFSYQSKPRRPAPQCAT